MIIEIVMTNKVVSIFNYIIVNMYIALLNPYRRIKVYKKLLGVKAGDNIRITGKVVFGSEPFLIELGNDITIARDVVFHTHDGGVWVFRKQYPGINVYRKIVVGDNVFIGAGSAILPGVTIGSNVVVAANSVVTKNCDSDSVYAGVPARRIKDLEEYKEKVLREAIFINASDQRSREQKILAHLEKLGGK